MKTTYKDNNFLEADDIKELENETDQYYYNVYTLGNWGVLGDLIFTNWRTEDLSKMHTIADQCKNGLDFGFTNDPTALVRSHFDKSAKIIYIHKEWQDKITEEIDRFFSRGSENVWLIKASYWWNI